MDLTELEKKSKKIIELRFKRKKLQEEINDIVQEIMQYMKTNDKNMMKAGNYSLEIADRIRRDFDFKALDELQARGLISENTMKKIKYERLLITSGTEIRLEGNKFIRR